MPDNHGGARPEQYKETVAPANPPQATAGPATVVAGMWYYLGPIALIVVVALIALLAASVILSKQRRQIERLIEEAAILSAEVRDLREARGPGADPYPASPNRPRQ